ncbi:alpha beta hydrolase fold protein [Lentinula edodes]|uniref:Alpha beta hydrolase fold protein n=1 Tax=Lentinula edodes TaxID=5353 RepID=A0A1Q3EIG8_LENED|nr:alpha beta hydrolase fold protein [Lentinula edodes]
MIGRHSSAADNTAIFGFAGRDRNDTLISRCVQWVVPVFTDLLPELVIYPDYMRVAPPKLDNSKYAAMGWPRYLWMKIKLMRLLFVLPFEILVSPLVARSKTKSFKRVVGDTLFRFVTDTLPDVELQYFLGTSVGIYSEWARKEKLPITIDELQGEGKLLWIGPKKTEKVILFCHGGAYIAPLQNFMLPFWRFIQLELERRGLEVGIAIMSYSVIPVAHFPTPLWQANQAIKHLTFVENVKPSNLQLALTEGLGDTGSSRGALEPELTVLNHNGSFSHLAWRT